jgi:hypothetical protein
LPTRPSQSASFRRTVLDVLRPATSPTTTRRALEDLAAYGIVNRTSQGQGNADLWALTDWARTRWPTVAESRARRRSGAAWPQPRREQLHHWWTKGSRTTGAAKHRPGTTGAVGE